jgi:alpha-glucosidase (family GH31 glycosyl hydrolase)
MEYSSDLLQFEPLADPKAMVHGPQVRFTILTDRLIRMEYSPSGDFEDRPSQIFWYRKQPLPKFSSHITEKEIQIDTEYLHLVYRISSLGFTPETLEIQLVSSGVRWRYGESAARSQNLLGTARTLDEAAGRIHLEDGLISRMGWAVVDDSNSPVFNSSNWLEPRGSANELDIYFFGYGHNYPACLQDYCRISGRVPLIPRWALGNWWSRYWEYSADELQALMSEFNEHQIPLTVCIVDMDWHLNETGNTCTGWTGYTWNRELFPDPGQFIQKLHRLGLKTALNLHPAEGIHPHEEQYDTFAQHMGLDPDAHKPIPFDPADPHFLQGYFELIHHPLESQGVDFWWIDWQQGTQTKINGLDPLWWLNHLHFYDLARDGNKRPFIFSRWGGLGNHRYPIGFSGDTVIGWNALDFQPGFTSSAANVGYGWWSHDIGGHMNGIEDDELFTRWVQYGVFSPILRLHSTKNLFHERRPWKRGPAAERVTKEALRLRHRLIPYLYSMAWRNFQTSLPLITPLYYSNPGSVEAYQCPQVYWFGSELLAAPFTKPADPETRLSRQVVWLPENGKDQPGWFDFFNGGLLSFGWRSIYGSLEDIPLFARAGAIVPLANDPLNFGAANPRKLVLNIFPGAENHFDLYEDDGETQGYLTGHSVITSFSQRWLGNKLEFKIHPAQGDLSLIPNSREFELHFKCLCKPDLLQILHNRTEVSFEMIYIQESNELILGPFEIGQTDELEVRLSTNEKSLIRPVDLRREKLRQYLNSFRVDTNTKKLIYQNWAQISMGASSLNQYSDLAPSQIQVLESLLD